MAPDPEQLVLGAVPEPAFGGETYEPARDGDRLRAQLGRTRAVMLDGEWHTLHELAARTGDPEASVSARLRDLRKPKFGGWIVEREYVADGLWRYRLLRPVDHIAGVAEQGS